MLPSFVIGDRGLGASGDTHPYWMMAYAEVGPYLIVGASAVGQIHLARKLPRDDAFVIRSVGPWLAVTVADGVGTRPLSRYGATYVVESLAALLLRKLTPPPMALSSVSLPTREDVELKDLAPPSTIEEVVPKPFAEFTSASQRKAEDNATQPSFQELRQIGSVGWWLSPALFTSPINHAQRPPTTSPVPQFNSTRHEPDLEEIVAHAFDNTHLGLRHHAASLGVELADLSCTALALLLNTETGRGVVGQIGDGALLGLSAQGKVEELVHAEDTGDPQSTYTISRPNFRKYLAKQTIHPSPDNPFKAFYVMTDGLSNDLLFSPNPVETWAKGVNAILQASSSPALAAAGMLNWLSTYQVKGSWDDRTLVVIMQREGNDGNSQSVSGQSEGAQSTDNH
jgi:hypothetical protein